MLVLNGGAVFACAHGGLVGLAPAQSWVTIAAAPVLVRPDPMGRPIAACPAATPTTPPCTLTIIVDEGASYSSYVTIDGQPVCKDTAGGRTNWSLLTTVPFSVRTAGQPFVTIDG